MARAVSAANKGKPAKPSNHPVVDYAKMVEIQINEPVLVESKNGESPGAARGSPQKQKETKGSGRGKGKGRGQGAKGSVNTTNGKGKGKGTLPTPTDQPKGKGKGKGKSKKDGKKNKSKKSKNGAKMQDVESGNETRSDRRCAFVVEGCHTRESCMALQRAGDVPQYLLH